MKVSIRQTERKDIPAIFLLVEELAIYEKARHELTLTLDAYYQYFDDGTFQSIVAEVDGDIVGTCIYYDTFSTWKGKMLYLEDFVVKETHRQYGVGQKLFDRYKDIAEQGGYALCKWQVLDWNEPALNFYLKNNATIEKGWWNGKIIL